MQTDPKPDAVPAKITVTTPHGDAVRKNTILAAFDAAPDKVDWTSKVDPAQQLALIQALFVKVNELELRLKALGG